MSPRAVGPRRGVQAQRCGCGAVVLTAVTSSGLDVTVGAAPLSPAGELQAVLAGLPTYTHHVGPGELHHRSAWSISARPAGSRPRQTVHPVHRCGDTWPALDLPAADPAPSSADTPPF